jgi:hypothetical protein
MNSNNRLSTWHWHYAADAHHYYSDARALDGTYSCPGDVDFCKFLALHKYPENKKVNYKLDY